MAKLIQRKMNVSVSGTSIVSKMSGLMATNRILSNVRYKVSDEKIRSGENYEYEEYLKRYKKSIIPCIEDIEFLVSNFITRNDMIIDREYDGYTIRKEFNDGKNHYNISIKILKNNVYFMCEDSQSKFYDNCEYINTSIYEQWNSILEEKYLEYLNRRSKKIFDTICNITKLNRKTKVNKLIEEDNSLSN